jgi:organizing structure protein 2
VSLSDLPCRSHSHSLFTSGRIKSFKSPTEPLTPGVLYVLTSTLFGTVLARSSILLRFTLPATLFFASAFRFLPETSANISNYIYGLEKEHAPELARIQSEVSRSTTNGVRAVGDGWSASRRAIENGVQKATGWIADTTGLKVHEAFGVARHTSHIVQEKAAESLHTLQEKAEKVLESK